MLGQPVQLFDQYPLYARFGGGTVRSEREREDQIACRSRERSGSRIVLTVIFFLALNFLCACNRSRHLEKQSQQGIALAEMYFKMLRDGRYDEIENTVDPSIRTADFRAGFDALAATIPREEPLSAKPILGQSKCQDGVCDTHVIIEYKYRDELLLFNVVLHDTGTRTSIEGMSCRVIPGSIIARNEFRFSGKGVGQYTILALAILFPLFSLSVLVICIRTTPGNQKWLWIPFILIGFSQLGVNWTTGQFDFKPIAIQLLSASASAEQYEPWRISISLPVGALLFVAAHNSRDRKRPSKGTEASKSVLKT